MIGKTNSSGGGTPIYDPILANNSWEAISQASLDGRATRLWKVGDEKDIAVNGETLTLVIMGILHDELSDGSGKAGITFGMKNLMAETRQMNTTQTNTGGFTGSAMYSWMTSTLLSALPTDLQGVIKTVNKKTSAGNTSSTINTNAMKLFLFSAVECGLLTTSNVYKEEGTTYPIFTDNESRIKYLANGSGESNIWWTRSPSYEIGGAFRIVDMRGLVQGGRANDFYGVCFGFCV